MNRLILVVLASLAASISSASEVVMGGSSLAAFDDRPVPDCPGGPINVRTNARDCPGVTVADGFTIRTSAYMPSDIVPYALRWMDVFEAVMTELENSQSYRRYFVERLRASGVSFYLLPTVGPGGETEPDPYFGRIGFAYHAAPRVIAVSLPISPSAWYGTGNADGSRAYDNRHGVGWSHEEIRTMLLHEMAHAYHDLALRDGFGNRCVLEAYAVSIGKGLHAGYYASSNEREFFAELVMGIGGGDDRVVQEPEDAGYWGEVNSYYNLMKYDPNAGRLLLRLVHPRGYASVWQSPMTYTPSTMQDPLVWPSIAEEGSVDCDVGDWWPSG